MQLKASLVSTSNKYPFVMHWFNNINSSLALKSSGRTVFLRDPKEKNIVFMTEHYRKTSLGFYTQNVAFSAILLLWNLLQNSTFTSALCFTIQHSVLPRYAINSQSGQRPELSVSHTTQIPLRLLQPATILFRNMNQSHCVSC